MVDRIKAAVDARTDDHFVIMARTDALAVEAWTPPSTAPSPAWKPAPT
jgi:2-methylisocitrate lyase-like PEP mutase family enzyme